VLVDSEVIACRVHADMLTRHGYPISADGVATRFLGRSARAARDEIEAHGSNRPGARKRWSWVASLCVMAE